MWIDIYVIADDGALDCRRSEDSLALYNETADGHYGKTSQTLMLGSPGLVRFQNSQLRTEQRAVVASISAPMTTECRWRALRNDA